MTCHRYKAGLWSLSTVDCVNFVDCVSKADWKPVVIYGLIYGELDTCKSRQGIHVKIDYLFKLLLDIH